MPTINESLSALKCIQIVGGSKSLFCGKSSLILFTDIYMLTNEICILLFIFSGYVKNTGYVT